MKILLPGFALLIGIVLAIWEGRDASGTAVPEPTSPAAAMPPSSLQKPQNAVDPALAIMERTQLELQRRLSVSARVRYQVDLFDQRLIGAGSYFQSGTGSDKKTRFELRMQMGEELVAWTEVCDGRFVWSAGETGFGRQLTRLDLKRIRQKEEQLRGTSSFTNGSPWTWAGLPKMLGSMQGTFSWDRALTGYLEPAKTPAWSLRGLWIKPTLAHFLPGQAEAINAAESTTFATFPQQMPGAVSFYVDQATYFPQRIEYRRPASGKDDQIPPEQWPICVVMEFTDVVLDRDVDPTVFVFDPNQQEELLDLTDGVLQGMGLADPG